MNEIEQLNTRPTTWQFPPYICTMLAARLIPESSVALDDTGHYPQVSSTKETLAHASHPYRQLHTAFLPLADGDNNDFDVNACSRAIHRDIAKAANDADHSDDDEEYDEHDAEVEADADAE